jgi:hypothetical protein
MGLLEILEGSLRHEVNAKLISLPQGVLGDIL